MPSQLARIALAPAVLLAASAALAADGVLEINQACATLTGCFDGDTPGLPVTITAAAAATSFRLTSDLVVATVNETGISIQTSRVQIDLGGFGVRGPVTCSGTPLVCSEEGTGDGISVNAVSNEAVHVRNGVVSGMGDHGVFVGNNGVVEDVRVTDNGGSGIRTNTTGLVRGCVAARNGDNGIVVSTGSTIQNSVADQNGLFGLSGGATSVLIENTVRRSGSSGISASAGSLVRSNLSSNNTGSGIAAGSGSTIADNTATSNTVHGLFCNDTCNVSGNTASGNGTAASGNAILCGGGCAVRANVVSASFGFALNLVSTAAYRENVINATGTGTVNAGVNRGDNHCTGSAAVSALCP